MTGFEDGDDHPSIWRSGVQSVGCCVEHVRALANVCILCIAAFLNMCTQQFFFKKIARDNDEECYFIIIPSNVTVRMLFIRVHGLEEEVL